MPEYPKDDCYETLGVHPEASQDVIAATWKKLTQTYHPDLFGNAASRDRLFAEEMLTKINAAYDKLKDPARRRTYDQWRSWKRQPPRPVVTPDNLNFGTLSPG